MSNLDCVAKYKGQCGYCFEEIEPGQPIKFWKKAAYHHPECWREAYYFEAKKEMARIRADEDFSEVKPNARTEK